ARGHCVAYAGLPWDKCTRWRVHDVKDRVRLAPPPGASQMPIKWLWNQEFQHADVAQLVERELPKLEVAGSRPVVRFLPFLQNQKKTSLTSSTWATAADSSSSPSTIAARSPSALASRAIPRPRTTSASPTASI